MAVQRRRRPRNWALLMPLVCKYCRRRFFNDVFRYLFHVRHHEMNIRPYWYDYRKTVVYVTIKNRKRSSNQNVLLQQNKEFPLERVGDVIDIIPSVIHSNSYQDNHDNEKLSMNQTLFTKRKADSATTLCPSGEVTNELDTPMTEGHDSQQGSELEPSFTHHRSGIYMCKKSTGLKSVVRKNSANKSVGDKESSVSQNVFKCKYCGRGFKGKHHLENHERTHTGEKPFKCKYCKKVFRCKTSMVNHERIHTGEKPFNCTFCEKCFKKRSHLQEHERIHTWEKPFKCKFCKTGFRHKKSLVNHEHTHTGEKPFK